MPGSFVGNGLGRYAFDPSSCAACLEKSQSVWSTASAAPSQQDWACAAPANASGNMTISWSKGNVSAADACRCHYSDLTAPPPPPPCPNGNYDECLKACAQLPPAKIAACIDDCNRLCPH